MRLQRYNETTTATTCISTDAYASMLVTLSKMDCIEGYWKAYFAFFDEQVWNEHVITVSCEDWNPHGYRDKRGIYENDHVHLNEKGYHILDSCITY